MAKRMISIPADLDELLRQYGDKLDDTVSRICQRALYAELNVKKLIHEEKKEKMSMLARLQEQSKLEGADVKQKGREAGAEWARDCADWEELRWFKGVVDDTDRSHNWQDIRNTIEEQWTEPYQEAQQGMFFNEWVEGFAEGAVEAFNDTLKQMGKA